MSQNKHDDGLKTYAIGMTVVLGIVVCTEIAALVAYVSAGYDTAMSAGNNRKIDVREMPQPAPRADTVVWPTVTRDRILHMMPTQRVK
ncbi:hypothetical protein HDR63_01125 [bacterium]|nr:hypothetical protein [bacterium]